ncbi:TPA: hypothetical protein KRJ07_003323 [Clostridioides difficile]|uniref:hypothetical protein n=1 Tax=Clostridioides TaxID=1870884 RepID=UPI0006BBB032|nr:hypothetical protein [Clostridioides difficile]MCC0699847.1 hypothetical protein [Clostridioides sp. ZZV15-6383]KPI57391.1 hypothetical protein IM33_00565 [Clostridioides difficile]VFH03785.1 Uncharacterised protein [Clostridioides difficile]VIB42388.1 Uncharacterised protein [Clostridioides difficile]VIB68779.1 Uncharacterised protein [Clostridioides difficile]
MKTRNEIIKDLEDRLFFSKFTIVDEIDWDERFGEISALEFCIDKHKEGWTLKQFKENLEKQSKNMYGDYINGFMSVLKRNIKDMERDGIGN